MTLTKLILPCAIALAACGNVQSGKEVHTLPPDTLQALPADAPPIDQSAGMAVIEGLNRAYGDKPGVVGGFIGNGRCPDYLEGMWFDGATLVLQVRGDTVRARRELEAAAGSGAFRIEQVGGGRLSQKQLHALVDSLNVIWDSVDPIVRANVSGWGATVDGLEVTLRLNTPEKQREFREKALDSPALTFTGTDGMEVCRRTGVSDTLGVSIRAEMTTVARNAETAAFVLHNEGRDTVECGESYTVAYWREGEWRVLPSASFFNAIAYVVPPGKQHRFVAHLHPLVNGGRAGEYRFFTNIEINGEKVTMMASFRLE